MTTSLTVDLHLDSADLEAALRDDVVTGLTAEPKVLPPKWFYDDRGSQLFDEITRLPEYYPTRRETEILVARVEEIARITRASTLVELGSGLSTKTRLLLDALSAAGTLRRFVPFDVSELTLLSAGATLARAYPACAVHAVVGDFERHLPLLPGSDRDGGPRLLAFLGGTVGNLAPAQRATFLREVADGLRPGDRLLLGTDLVKDRDRLVAAYDDAAGVTADFNRNVLNVINRELGGNFAPDRFDHVAVWDDDEEWIEMRLRSQCVQLVELSSLDLTVGFAAGEEVRTEISAKFRREGIERELGDAGLELQHWWTDAAGDFALSLSVRG